jgi:hypothetical protein
MVRPTSTLFSLNISPLAAVTLVLGSCVLPGANARASHVGRGCNGEHLAKRNPYLFPEESSSNSQLLKRQDAQGYSPDNLDPVSQCTGYSYQPVLDNKANFPTIWDTAQLVPGDQEAADELAKAVAEVNRLAPNISVKGTLNGDFCEWHRVMRCKPSPLTKHVVRLFVRSQLHPDLPSLRPGLLVDVPSMRHTLQHRDPSGRHRDARTVDLWDRVRRWSEL